MKNIAADRISHVYGITGSVLALLSLALAWKLDSPWSEYALMASGWVAAFTYAAVLWRVLHPYHQSVVALGEATEREKQLRDLIDQMGRAHAAELEKRSATADFLAGLMMGKPATAREMAPREKTEDTK